MLAPLQGKSLLRQHSTEVQAYQGLAPHAIPLIMSFNEGHREGPLGANGHWTKGGDSAQHSPHTVRQQQPHPHPFSPAAAQC